MGHVFVLAAAIGRPPLGSSKQEGLFRQDGVPFVSRAKEKEYPPSLCSAVFIYSLVAYNLENENKTFLQGFGFNIILASKEIMDVLRLRLQPPASRRRDSRFAANRSGRGPSSAFRSSSITSQFQEQFQQKNINEVDAR